MDNIRKFLSSIYLGDRFCEDVKIIGSRIIFQINCISRLKEGALEWNYYSESDIEHGYLVFDDVVEFSSSSKLPFNDEIYEIEAIEKKNDVYAFIVRGCNISDDAVSSDIEWRIKAKKFYIFNPQENCKISE